MSLLDKSNKENSNSVMEGIADKYNLRFKPHFNGEVELSYEDNEFRLSSNEFGSDFNFDTINDMYNDVQREFTLSTDLNLHIRVCDSFPKDQITIKSSEDIELKPTVRNEAFSRVVTMQNINIFANLLEVSCSCIKLLDVNIESYMFVLYNLTRERLSNNISGHVKSSRVKMYMNNDWDFKQMFESIVGSNIRDGFLNGKVNKKLLKELQNINPIKRSGINIFDTNTYYIGHHDKCFVITRKQSIINTFKELSYKMADGWYLIYTDEPIDLYGITD